MEKIEGLGLLGLTLTAALENSASKHMLGVIIMGYYADLSSITLQQLVLTEIGNTTKQQISSGHIIPFGDSQDIISFHCFIVT